MQESSVGTLVDEHELTAAFFDTRVNARNKIALDHQIVVVSATHVDVFFQVGDFNRLVPKTHNEAGRGLCPGLPPERRHHGGRLVRLPQQLEERDFTDPAADGRNIDLTRLGRPLRTHLLDRRTGHDDLTCFGLRGHAVRRMHGRTENIVLLFHHWTEMTTDTNRHRNAVFASVLVGADPGLHLRSSAHCIIDAREGAHHFVADGLDDSAIELVGSVFHDLQAASNGFTGLGVTELVIQLGATDNIGEQNCDFQVFCHLVLTQPLADATRANTESTRRTSDYKRLPLI